MTIMSNEQFAEYVLNLAKDAPPFEPNATYYPEGDCIEFFASPAPFYGDRIDDFITVYRRHETDEITGLLIKGISGICKHIPGFKNEIKQGSVKLEYILFLAKLFTSKQQATYQKLIDMAEENDVRTRLAGVE